MRNAPEALDPHTLEFYHRSMRLLDEAGVEYLVGGAYALAYHAGVIRHTKDLDLFIRGRDLEHTLGVLRKAGYQAQVTFPHWLAKAFDARNEEEFVDLIFGSGNGLCPVDDEWFVNAVKGEALGRPARLCPAEEIVWSKSFVMERERYDGADIAHIILSRGQGLDWKRLLRRFEGHERVLLAHLTLFGYIFPAEKENVPEWVMEELSKCVEEEGRPIGRTCRGTFLSRQQYLVDTRERGYRDARVRPEGPMKGEDVAQWTAAINTIK